MARSVYHYLDYREYLRDVFEARKAESPWYSFKIMGDGVGLDQSQVYRILNGQLQVSKAKLPAFLEYLELKGPAAEYFERLVNFSRCRKEAESRKLFAELLERRGSRCRTLEGDQYLLYSEWHHPVVRALVGSTQVTDDYERLGRMLTPHITAAQAKKSIELLRRLKLVERDSMGVWRLTGTSVSTGSAYHSLVIRQYQAHSFKLAEESLGRHAVEDRDVNVINMAVDQPAFQDCIAILKEARRQIQQRLEKVENPDRVMRLAQAFFPVATSKPGGEK